RYRVRSVCLARSSLSWWWCGWSSDLVRSRCGTGAGAKRFGWARWYADLAGHGILGLGKLKLHVLDSALQPFLRQRVLPQEIDVILVLHGRLNHIEPQLRVLPALVSGRLDSGHDLA